jgi:hypothetical protein
VKAKGCAVVGCLGAAFVVFAVGSLVLLRLATQVPPEPGPGEPTPQTARIATPKPTADPDVYLLHPGEWRHFVRTDDGPRYRLRFGFVDYTGKRHEIRCTLDREAVEEASRTFGWDEAEIQSELNAALQKEAERQLEDRGIAPYVRITIQKYGGWRWEYIEWPSEEGHQQAIRGFTKWLEDEFPKRRDLVEARVFRRHGLLVRNNSVYIDHNGLARAASTDLERCYDALSMTAGESASDRYFIGLMLAFFQELQYQVPPDKMGTRDTMGLWVPGQVLRDGKGDCDSKAVAFASLWRRRASRVIVILVPQHALIGVEGKPGPREKFVRVGNRYFILCEVAGPGKTPPGYHDIAGSFEYVMIDPLSSS